MNKELESMLCSIGIGALHGLVQFIEEHNDSKCTVVHAKSLHYC